MEERRLGYQELYELNGLVKSNVSTLQSIEKDLHKLTQHVTSHNTDVEKRLDVLEDSLLQVATTINILKWVLKAIGALIAFLLAETSHIINLFK